MSLVPYVVRQTGRGERSQDIFSMLLEDRIVMLSEEVNDTSASLVVSQLLYWKVRILKRISVSISTAPEVLLLPVWRFMTLCSISNAMYLRYV